MISISLCPLCLVVLIACRDSLLLLWYHSTPLFCHVLVLELARKPAQHHSMLQDFNLLHRDLACDPFFCGLLLIIVSSSDLVIERSLMVSGYGMDVIRMKLFKGISSWHDKREGERRRRGRERKRKRQCRMMCDEITRIEKRVKICEKLHVCCRETL